MLGVGGRAQRPRAASGAGRGRRRTRDLATRRLGAGPARRVRSPRRTCGSSSCTTPRRTRSTGRATCPACSRRCTASTPARRRGPTSRTTSSSTARAACGREEPAASPGPSPPTRRVEVKVSRSSCASSATSRASARRAAALAAGTRTLAWLAQRYGVSTAAGATVSFTSRGSNRWPAGASGHDRDDRGSPRHVDDRMSRQRVLSVRPQPDCNATCTRCEAARCPRRRPLLPRPPRPRRPRRRRRAHVDHTARDGSALDHGAVHDSTGIHQRGRDNDGRPSTARRPRPHDRRRIRASTAGATDGGSAGDVSGRRASSRPHPPGDSGGGSGAVVPIVAASAGAAAALVWLRQRAHRPDADTDADGLVGVALVDLLHEPPGGSAVDDEAQDVGSGVVAADVAQRLRGADEVE